MWGRDEKLGVIIVEDEPRIMGMIIRKIEAVVGGECEVIGSAINGVQALELIKVKRPHIVFTDIKMPVMDGLELSKVIKERFPNIFVVIISGFSEFSFAQQAMRYGVFNYLLKPIVEEKLKETVEEIKEEIERVQIVIQRNIVIPQSKKEGKGIIEEIFAYPRQKLFLICFNNICLDSNDEVLVEYYTHQLIEIDWKEILESIGIEHEHWLVLDEYMVNQKSLILSVNESQDSRKLAEQLKQNLEESYKELHINICTHQGDIDRDEMWIYTQRMRNTLLRCIGIDGGSVYLLEEEEGKTRIDVSRMIENRINHNIHKALEEQKNESVEREVRGILEYLKNNQVKQKQQEKILIQIASKFKINSSDYDIEAVKEKELEWLRLMSTSKYVEVIEEAFWRYIKEYQTMDRKVEEKKNVRLELKEYVDKHFMEIERIEDVADVFNYNYTYLSRLFKKITGLSMNKYITQKRVEEAKLLMRKHPGLGIQRVAELVGYKDQHYFSRIFKGATGDSPSEYKENRK